MLGSTLYLPVWRNSSVALVARRGPAPPRALALDARPTHALVFHRQRQPREPHPCAAHNGGCEHICVTAYVRGAPHAHCLCAHGWRAAGRACERVRVDAYVLLARGAPPLVQALALRHAGWEAAAPATDAARPTAADADTQAGYLYYCDVHRYEIVRQRLDGGGREVFAGRDVDNCEGIAVDWMGRNLYWTDDALGTVSAARLDAPGVRRVLVAGAEPHYHPRSIALEPGGGLMYWAVWAGGAGAGRLEVAHMSGRARRVLLGADLHWPGGLALAGGALYWCDTFLNKIERLQLSSGARQLVAADAAHAPLLKPYGLAVYEGETVVHSYTDRCQRQRLLRPLIPSHVTPPR